MNAPQTSPPSSARSPSAGVAIIALGLWILACSGSRELGAPTEQVTAAELVAAYDANGVAAAQRFDGKTIQVSGTIDRIDSELLGRPYVTLIPGAVKNVQAVFPSDAKDRIARLQKGAAIIVKGRVSGQLMNVILEDCEVVR